jgi:hypothetical protein
MRSAREVCREFDGASGLDRVGDLGGPSGRLAADSGRLRVHIHLLHHAGHLVSQGGVLQSRLGPKTPSPTIPSLAPSPCSAAYSRTTLTSPLHRNRCHRRVSVIALVHIRANPHCLPSARFARCYALGHAKEGGVLKAQLSHVAEKS